MSRQPDEKEKFGGGPAERVSILWHSYLTGDRSCLDAPTRAVRQLFKRLPSANRCRVCNAPFEGLGGILVSLAGFGRGSRAHRRKRGPRLAESDWTC